MRASLAGRVCVPLWLFVAAGCGSDSHVAGPPTLRHFLVQVPGASDVDLLAPPDGGVPAVSGVASLRLVFDRLLAGEKIEMITAAGSMGRTDVVTATWTGAPAGAPPIVATTFYDPSGALGVNVPGPKILVQLAPGLPSGAQVSFKLDRTKITSKANEPFMGADVHTVATQPFAVAIDVAPDASVPANQAVSLQFTNAPAMDVLPRIKVAGGIVEVVADTSDPRKFTLSPMSGWLPGQTYTVTVDKDAADRFGVKLGTDFVARFSIWPLTDAGAPDAASAEAGAGAGDAAAATDAGAGNDGGAATDGAAGEDGGVDAPALDAAGN